MDAAFVSTNVADFNASKLCDRFSGTIFFYEIPSDRAGKRKSKICDLENLGRRILS